MPNNYILYHDNSCETGRALKDALRIEGGTSLNGPVDHLIRWGNRREIPRKPIYVLNKRAAMDMAGNKDRAIQFMRENDISCPPIATRFEGKLLLARKTSHMHGSGSFFVTSQFDFDNAKRVGCTNFVEFISIKNEYRVHVFGNEVIFLYERVLPSEPTSLNIRNDWNEERRTSREVPRGIIDASINVVNQMGLDFGGVDIGISVNGNVFIFEVNTAPSLVDGNIKKPSFNIYLEKFREFLSR